MWRKLAVWWKGEPMPDSRPTAEELKAFVKIRRDSQESMRKQRDQTDRLDRLLRDLDESDDSRTAK